jgi:hypothetical protein
MLRMNTTNPYSSLTWKGPIYPLLIEPGRGYILIQEVDLKGITFGTGKRERERERERESSHVFFVFI